jgi:hypothetical protein
VLYSTPTTRGGDWSSALIYGANKHTGGGWENSVTAESNLDLDGRNSVFGRLEYVRKSAEDLAVAGTLPPAEFDIGSLVLGYVRDLGSLGRTAIGVGATGTLGFVPADLEPSYGTRTPTGLAVYVRLRPKVMQMGQDSMPGMRMPMDSERPADSDRSSSRTGE